MKFESIAFYVVVSQGLLNWGPLNVSTVVLYLSFTFFRIKFSKRRPQRGPNSLESYFSSLG